MSSTIYNKKSKMEDVWDDTELIKMYEDSIKFAVTAKSGESSGAQANSSSKWKIGDKCTAPYQEDGLWYSAIIVSIDGNQAQVEYEGYDGETDWVQLSDLAMYSTAEEEASSESSEVATSSAAKAETRDLSANTETSAIPISSPLPPFAPPPPPIFNGIVAPDQVEALSSMLMSWYMSGYHTGCYITMQQMKKKDGN